jgi:DivIVA domain-containing protein
LSPEDVAHRGFATVRRGFDQHDVRAFLEAVAAELRRLRDRVNELDPATAPPRSPTEVHALDIATLTTALGEETARVLRVAQEAAADVKARAEESAARFLAEAREESSRLRSTAEALLAERTAEADEMAAKLRSEIEAEMAQLRADTAAATAEARASAQAEADAAVSGAVEKGRQMVNEAQAARERMLTDLARRRKAAVIQLEQLRAGRDRLLEAYRAVRASLDEITDELGHADEEARAAAEAAARRALSGPAEIGIDHDQQVALPSAPMASPAESPEGAPAEATATPSLEAESSQAPESSAALASATSAAVTAPAAPPPSRPEPRHRGRRRLRAGGDGAPAAALPPSVVGETQADAAGEAVVGAASADASDGGVDQLFAKIRADRAEAPEAAPDRALVAGSEPIEPIATETGAESAPVPEPAEGHDMEPPRSNADEAWLQRRDQLVDPLAATLTRKVKRLLQDEQNLVLARLRTHRGRLASADILPDAGDHPALYVAAGEEVLAAAEAVGATLAAVIDPDGAPGKGEVDKPALHELAEAMAADLLDPLRARLERSLAEDEIGQAAATDAINAAYRELKSRRIERAVGDQLTAAVSLGLRRALAEGTRVCWVVEDVDGACPDCDDNALAGPTPLGAAFPTGQLAPPAHPGCRCLLGPAPT